MYIMAIKYEIHTLSTNLYITSYEKKWMNEYPSTLCLTLCPWRMIPKPGAHNSCTMATCGSPTTDSFFNFFRHSASPPRIKRHFLDIYFCDCLTKKNKISPFLAASILMMMMCNQDYVTGSVWTCHVNVITQFDCFFCVKSILLALFNTFQNSFALFRF